VEAFVLSSEIARGMLGIVESECLPGQPDHVQPHQRVPVECNPTGEPGRSRNREVRDRELVAPDDEPRPSIAHETIGPHAVEIVADEGEQVDIVIEVDPVAQVPQIRLVDSVSTQTHVHRLEPRVEGSQALAPRLLISDTHAEGEGISRTDDPGSPWRHVPGELTVAAEALCIGSHPCPRAIEVRQVHVRKIDPAELLVVFGVLVLGDAGGVEHLIRDEQEARGSLQCREQESDHRDVDH
jgi:hypothetical protein